MFLFFYCVCMFVFFLVKRAGIHVVFKDSENLT